MLLLVFSGCSYFARFSPPVKQEVDVILKENDFAITKTNLEGTAGVFYLFSVIPIGDERLYSRAMASLCRNVEGDIVNTPSQLINWSVDDVKTFFLIGSYNKVQFRADLMQFVK